jgi:hypothetical protein
VLLPDYGNRTAAQELIDAQISNRECNILGLAEGWCWRSGISRLGESVW